MLEVVGSIPIISTTFFAFAILLGSPIVAQTTPSVMSPPHLIALIPPGAVEVLELTNTAANSCLRDNGKIREVEAQEACTAQALVKLKASAKTQWEISLYERPELPLAGKGGRWGVLRILAEPGVGLKAQLFDAQNSKFVKVIESELTQGDWGYGHYFEFTVSAVQGDWVQLPRGIVGQPVWLNLAKDWNSKDVPRPYAVDVDGIYATSFGDIVITAFSKTEFTYREENANDMPCGEEPQKVSPQKLRLLKKPIAALYHPDGRLNLRVKYPRGC